ncbi:hypothetical protein SDC9_197654 [bioreactor metagenome]|uniref:Uncharacterized protein n=1 Tax=bioreactor metagenome TaxID=1076179 RepID=A0A645IHS4_9ZZZZ
MTYVLDMLEHAGFRRNLDTYKIIFSGILKNNIFDLYIQYRGLEYHNQLKGKKQYILRTINSCSGTSSKLAIDSTLQPILTYSPPVDTKQGTSSYCMLDEEKVEHWYSKFKIKHYYVIYAEVKSKKI